MTSEARSTARRRRTSGGARACRCGTSRRTTGGSCREATFGYAWLTAAWPRRATTSRTRRLRWRPCGEPAAGWHLGSVVYQVFPDRFASSGARHRPAGVGRPPASGSPAWTDRRRARVTPVEFFGGDLPGVRAAPRPHRALGANVLYLTPVLPRRSRRTGTTPPRSTASTRCSAATRRWPRSSRAAHARGIRVIGDLTTQPLRPGHEWFLAAPRGPGRPSAEFFCFDDSLPYGYECWSDVPTLPKLDHRSRELRARARRRRGSSVVRRWLRPAVRARRLARRRGQHDRTHGAIDDPRGVAKDVRAAAVAVRPDALLVAEHGHDASADLRGDGLARDDELRGLHAAGVVRGCADACRRAVTRVPSGSRWACRSCRAIASSSGMSALPRGRAVALRAPLAG